MWNENSLTETLRIKYPVILAGMAGGVTTPELVAAVSNSGALGTLGAGYMSAAATKEAVKKIKQLTDKPFGVNVFVPSFPEVSESEVAKANGWLSPYREALHISEPEDIAPSPNLFGEQIAVIIEEEVPVCSFTFGLPPEETVRKLKSAGITVIGSATTVEEAILNENRGADMVVVQGSEAGGHRGTFNGPFKEAMIGTMALVPQAADHVKIPVIAAGGIMDGRGVMAALVLGATGAQMGTAFVTCAESGAKPQHKQAILKSREDQTVVTQAFSGKPARGIQNDFIEEMAGRENHLPAYPIQNSLTKGIRAEAAKQDRAEWMSLWSGQGTRLSRSESAAEILNRIVDQCNNINLS